MFLSECREFPSASCLAGEKKNLMTARVSMLLKSRVSLKCFRACFFPGRDKDLSAPRVSYHITSCHIVYYRPVYVLRILIKPKIYYN